MAGKTNANIGFEKQLWDAACVLWGHIPAAEYRKVIIGLIFLRYISAAFDKRYQELIAEGDGFEDDRDAYEMDNVFFVPEEARWSNIASKAHTPEIGTIIDNAMDDANNLKIKLQKEKMSLSWVKYKKIIEEFLRKAFDNCKLIEDFEDKTKLNNIYDFMTEDHFYVGYINKTLEGELMKYQKRYYGLPQNSRKGYIRCKLCGDMIVRTNNKKMYCEKCANAKEKYRKRNNAYKYRKVAK